MEPAINDKFWISIKDPQNEEIWFSTKNKALVLFDKYVWFGFEVPSVKIFGIGERLKTFGIPSFANYTGWASGQDPTYDNGEGGHNGNGDHPFILAQLNSGKFMGAYLKNSNAKVTQVVKHEQSTTINFYLTGGIIDLYMFHADTAEGVIKKYH